jgi:hypothetical protein
MPVCSVLNFGLGDQLKSVYYVPREGWISRVSRMPKFALNIVAAYRRQISSVLRCDCLRVSSEQDTLQQSLNLLK